MNAEFQIHGVLSSGQAMWKQKDQDYYKQFYSNQTEDVLMIVEIVDRPHGVSTYYNYLRNNNILSAREGSYFGMTIRIDNAFCRDAKEIFIILDNLFNKMIVDRILKQKGDKFEYNIDSFTAQKEFLQQLEKQFFNMLNAFCSQNDFITITYSWASQRMKRSINVYEITSNISLEIIKQKVKLYLSPNYQTITAQKKIEAEKMRADAFIEEAETRIRTAERNSTKINEQRKIDIDNWQREKKELEMARDTAIQENRYLEEQIKKEKLNASINENISKIKQPLIELTELITEQFKNQDRNKKTSDVSLEKTHRGKERWLHYWLPCIVLSMLCFTSIYCSWSSRIAILNEIHKKYNEIEQLKEELGKMLYSTNSSSSIGLSQGQNISDFQKLKIDIKELSSSEKYLKKGKTYNFSIIGGKYPKDGKWVVLEGNKETSEPKLNVTADSGTQVSITYRFRNTIVAKRTIKIE